MLDLDKNKPALVLDLTKEQPLLKLIHGTLNWDPHPLYASSITEGYDLDIFLIGVKADGKVDLTALNAKGQPDNIVYFNNKHHKSGAFAVPVDNQTGEGDDDEFFTAQLDIMPAEIDQLHVYVFIHEAQQRKQTFGKIANTRFEVSNGETGDVVVRYQVTQEFKDETALHVATIARNGGGWEIRPVGTGGVFDPNQVLQAYM